MNKKFPYSVRLYKVIEPDFDGTTMTRAKLDRHVAKQMALSDELAKWCEENIKGKWRKCQMEFDFARIEDAIFFRLRAPEPSEISIHPLFQKPKE